MSDKLQQGDPEAAASTLLSDFDIDHVKRTYYERDIYVREVLTSYWLDADAHERATVRNTALLILKPCALISGRAVPTLEWLYRNGFKVIGQWEFTLDPNLSRALWQYSINKASIYRMWVIDTLLPATPAVALLLRGTPDSNAARQLSTLKGPADQSRQRHGQLRAELMTANFLLNYVHASDDPIDVLRELAIICGVDAGIRCLRSSLSAETRSLDRVKADVAATVSALPTHDLSLESASRGLANSLGLRGNVSPVDVLDLVCPTSPNGRVKGPQVNDCDPIDFGVFVSHLLPMSVAGRENLVASISGT